MMADNHDLELEIKLVDTVVTNPENGQLNVDEAVHSRYSAAAQAQEQALCCPVDYDSQYLKVIPQEILDRDYGCGDPSKHVSEGETVLDLGSGGGKICYIASQVVGAEGHVIGIDYNEEMLGLANQYKQEIADRIGFQNVEFRKGKIQDLKLNLALLEDYLQENPVRNAADWIRVEEHAESLRNQKPLVEDDSVDVVVSNCVLNLVKQSDRVQLFREIYRVLKRGGRAVISDIVSDETVPEKMKNDPELWSGCISGAFREDEFLQAFEDAGFYGIEILEYQSKPWVVEQGIEFRSMTIQAFKGKDGPCLDRKQAVIYQGPWKAVIDDDGHKLVRGQRMAVCDKTYNIYSKGPYREEVIAIQPNQLIPLDKAEEFVCRGVPIRDAKETKEKSGPLELELSDDCCNSDGCC